MTDAAVAEAEPAVTVTRDWVAAVSARVQRPNLSTGDHAALRRLFLTSSATADGVVVGLLVGAGVPDGAWLSPSAFARWRLLAHVAAVVSGTAAVQPHSPAHSLGRALHAAGYSENRFLRLTTARGSALVDQIVRAARYLAQAGQVPVDLRPFHSLTSEDAERAEAARLRLAQDYYAAHHSLQRDSQ